MFFRLNVSEAAAKIATSSMPACLARSRPMRFGTSAEYVTPGCLVSPRATSTPSAICGTRFGSTNAATSIAGSPAADSRSMNATLSAVAIGACSFCRPSRGPTSTTRTSAQPSSRRSCDLQQADAGLHQFADTGRTPWTRVPSRGARTAISIFMASSFTRTSPLRTACPGPTRMAVTRAGIGAERRSAAARPPRRRPAASGPISRSNTSPSTNTCRRFPAPATNARRTSEPSSTR